MTESPIIVWIRRDLRLHDNPALSEAAKRGSPLIPVFIWAPEEEGNWSMGEAQRWWLHYALSAFSTSLLRKGLNLILRRGPSRATLFDLAKATGAQSVFWNTVYEPAEKLRDDQVTKFLRENGIESVHCDAQLLHDPDTILTGSGTPYKVYTPFWRNVEKNLVVPSPLEVPDHMAPFNGQDNIPSLHIDELELRPKLNWATEFYDTWSPGEHVAIKKLSDFMDGHIDYYSEKRDLPHVDGTSILSPHLHFGEISARTIWHEITKEIPFATKDERKIPFLKQLIWREFAYHLIHHFPHTSDQNLRSTFDRFPWSQNQEKLTRWQKGETGYPIVDAGMRQLWRTGWMHNRVRMIVASFLTKHLLTHWLDGAKWFWDTLLDANLPNNTMGWQWASGSGADAQPFFRIFNPMNQGKKFDPKGIYVRKWVPELERVPNSYIHEPWLMTSSQQHQANVKIGSQYPSPIVNHKEAREFALDAYRNISN